MSRRSYKQLDDKATADPSTSGRRTRGSRSATNSALVLGLTTNIGELTKQTSKLERSLVRLGTANDNTNFRQRIQDDQHDTTQLVKSTIESLATAQPLLDGVQYKRLSLQFEQQYKRYTALTKQIDDKQKQLISHSQSQSQSHGAYQHNNINGSSSRQNGGSGGHHYNTHSTADDYRQPLTSDTADYYGSQQQQQQQYEDSADDVVFTETEHEEIVRRVEEIKQIETEVAEVAQLYKDLHTLVNEQQTSIDVISENVESVAVKVEAADEQIVLASNNQRSARRSKCWVALIVVLVISAAIVVLLVLKKTNVF